MARDRGPSGPSGRCRSRTRPARPAGRAGDGGLRWSSARASGHASRRRSGPCAEALRCPRSAMAVERRDGPMGLLEGKRALIFGVANDHSIAWGIAQAFHREGATIGLSSLEASVRCLAADLGPRGVRVNAISAGPVRTLAASGVAGFKGLYGEFRDTAPLRRNITIEDVGGAAVYLSSDLAAGVTGEVHYVDAGFNVLAVPTRE